MLTIKIIQDGVTTISESENFAFYDDTSGEYREVMALAEGLKEKRYQLKRQGIRTYVKN